MGFGEWLKDIVSVPADGEEEQAVNEQSAAEEEVAEPAQPQPKSRFFGAKEAHAPEAPVTRPASNIKVVLAKPENFEDGRSVADHLNAKRTVVLNLEGTNKDICRRLIDFLSGVAYANDGQIKRVANSTYIITPRSVDVMGDMILDELESSGLYNNV